MPLSQGSEGSNRIQQAFVEKHWQNSGRMACTIDAKEAHKLTRSHKAKQTATTVMTLSHMYRVLSTMNPPLWPSSLLNL